MEYPHLENNILKKESFSSDSPSKNLNEQHEDKSGNEPQNNKGQNFFFKKQLYFLWDFLKIVLIAAIIVLPIRYFLFQPFIVKGESMVPSFQSGDYLIVDEISYKFKDPQRGDVVVLKYPLDPSQRFIKRIIGLPGETIEIENGKIEIIKDGKNITLDEKKYLPENLITDGDIRLTLPENKYFVLGDNRPFSYDSRRWGPLPKSDIVGKAILRVFPITDISFIASPSY